MKLAATLLGAVALAVAFSACGEDEGAASAVISGETASIENANAPSGEGSRGGEVWRTEAPPDEEHPGQAEFGAPPLEFEADPNGKTAYTTDHVTAKEGNVTIEFTNPQSTPHNVAIEGSKFREPVVTETIEEDFAATTITLNTDEDFIFYCTVPGHRKAGMKGVVTVKPA